MYTGGFLQKNESPALMFLSLMFHAIWNISSVNLEFCYILWNTKENYFFEYLSGKSEESDIISFSLQLIFFYLSRWKFVVSIMTTASL